MDKNEFKKTLQGVYGYKIDYTIEHYCIGEKSYASKMINCDFGDRVMGFLHRDHPFEIIDNRLVIKFKNHSRKVSYKLGKEMTWQEMSNMGQRKAKEAWDKEHG